eukprot:621232-Pyramimonas_sp.AAC.1
MVYRASSVNASPVLFVVALLLPPLPPRTWLGIIAGDLNLADMPPMRLGADHSIDAIGIITDWRASKDPVLSPILASLTEIDAPDPTRYNKALGTINIIDSICLSFSGLICIQLFFGGQ